MHDFADICEPSARRRLRRIKLIFEVAERLGLRRDLLFLANEAFAGSPPELRADWRAGRNGSGTPACRLVTQVISRRPREFIDMANLSLTCVVRLDLASAKSHTFPEYAKNSCLNIHGCPLTHHKTPCYTICTSPK
ncbi:MAG: hypothetical protein IJQ73_00570 [Kiritimatiellae bacterium]|nr:hypothetical protein [Kiritimatiellia bacterium]